MGRENHDGGRQARAWAWNRAVIAPSRGNHGASASSGGSSPGASENPAQQQRGTAGDGCTSTMCAPSSVATTSGTIGPRSARRARSHASSDCTSTSGRPPGR